MWKQGSEISDTFPRCVPAGCTLQPPAACGCLSGRFSHCVHGQGWLPSRSVWLQVKRCYQHLCRHPQGKEWLFIPFKSLKLTFLLFSHFVLLLIKKKNTRHKVDLSYDVWFKKNRNTQCTMCPVIIMEFKCRCLILTGSRPHFYSILILCVTTFLSSTVTPRKAPQWSSTVIKSTVTTSTL